jgi:hypothetical protein
MVDEGLQTITTAVCNVVVNCYTEFKVFPLFKHILLADLDLTQVNLTCEYYI